MKIYKIKVNGKTYKVELESVVENTESIASKEAPKATPSAVSTPSNGEGNQVVSPIQGTVVNVKVNLGSKVKKGDVLLVVEAMKLENDIVSPFDGEVSAVLVNKGQTVSAKQAVIVIK